MKRSFENNVTEKMAYLLAAHIDLVDSSALRRKKVSPLAAAAILRAIAAIATVSAPLRLDLNIPRSVSL